MRGDATKKREISRNLLSINLNFSVQGWTTVRESYSRALEQGSLRRNRRFEHFRRVMTRRVKRDENFPRLSRRRRDRQ